MGFENIVGYPSKLKMGFDALGVHCDLFTRELNQFGYQHSRQRPIVRCFNHIFGLYQFLYQRNNIFLKIIRQVLDLSVVSILFLYSLFRYDVFIFTYKKCFFQHLGFIDLPVLKRFNKTIVFVFFGSDTRPPYINGAYIYNQELNSPKSLNQIRKRALKWKKDIVKIERHADFLISGPATSHFHTKNIISFLHIGIPYVNKTSHSNKNKNENDIVRILHSPSRPKAKGTYAIRNAIDSLKRKGHHIDYIEIKGQPNHVVLKELNKCDFIIDQLYSPTPMPGFVTEAAAFGKPAVICGYFHKQIQSFLPPELLPPSHYRHPDDIEASIEKLITDKSYRIKLGQKARDFIQNQWHPRKVAERFLMLIHARVPDSWYYNPMDIRDVHGACLSENDARNILKSLLKKYGKDALCLQDKPALEDLFIQFANS
jgi:hypothetical protein